MNQTGDDPMTQQYDPREDPDNWTPPAADGSDVSSLSEFQLRSGDLNARPRRPDVSEATVDAWKKAVSEVRPNRPQTHRVDVTLTSGGFGQVLVDGMDVSALCTGLTVFSVPRRGPKVVLELDGRPVKLVSDAAAVEVGGDTYDLLTRLGWTPPAAPQVPVASERKDVQD